AWDSEGRLGSANAVNNASCAYTSSLAPRRGLLDHTGAWAWLWTPKLELQNAWTRLGIELDA
ncbi:hypothetical protein PIB30_102658, partial [Stylosanthes scabra]|nr:hypothetical protein [Stylosanthes scabra]